MANDLASYRTLIDNILATAVDAATWTDAIKDESLRQALYQFDALSIYEDSFTVTAATHEQLITLTGLNNIIAVAYPWSAGDDFASRQQYFRHTDDQTIYFEDIQPVIGQKIQVRYSKLHTIKDLDSAAATTVPTRHSRIISLLGAIHATTLRIRQLSENPAIPLAATHSLESVADRLSLEANRLLSSIRTTTAPRWPTVGL